MTHPCVQLSELANVVTKGTTPTTLGYEFADAGIPFIRVNNLGDRYLNFEQNTLFIDSETDRALKRSRIVPGDVLLAIAGTIGRTSIVPEAAPPLNCNQAVCIIRLDEAIDRSFLRHWLASEGAIKQIGKSKVTGVISNLSLTQVKNLRVPLPPLPEQRRIAAILDKADALRQKRRQAIAKLDQLLQSVFLDMFGDPVTNPKGWPLACLGDLGDWKSGGTPSRNNVNNFDGAVPWYSSGELNNIFVEKSVECISDQALQESAAKLIEPGSLLLGMYDTAAFKSSITTVPATCNQAIAFAKIERTKCNTYYLYEILQVGKEHYRRLQRGVRQKNLNLSMVRDTKAMLPPIAEQEKFARIFLRIFGQSKANEAALAKIENLFGSLQQRAFNGTL